MLMTEEARLDVGVSRNIVVSTISISGQNVSVTGTTSHASNYVLCTLTPMDSTAVGHPVLENHTTSTPSSPYSWSVSFSLVPSGVYLLEVMAPAEGTSGTVITV